MDSSTPKPLNGYICFVESVRVEIYAESLYAASVQAKATYKGRKKNPTVNVHLAELAGETVTQTITN